MQKYIHKHDTGLNIH